MKRINSLRRIGLLMMNIGHTAMYSDNSRMAVTLLHLSKTYIIDIKGQDKCGYNSVILGTGDFKNKYSLYVFVNVNKRQIKLAIESLFDVKISSINVVRIKPKYRRFRGVIGCEKQKKKVYFSLMDGQKLDIMSV